MTPASRQEKWLLEIQMAATQAELGQVDKRLVVKKDALGHRLSEEDLQSAGLQRLHLCVELACFAAAWHSEEGSRARVLRFPQRGALCLYIGDDICMSLTCIPEGLNGVMGQWAREHLKALGYQMLRTQEVRERFIDAEPCESQAFN